MKSKTTMIYDLPRVTFNGFDSYHLAQWRIPDRHEATACIDKYQKLTYHKSNFSFDLIDKSWKYGTELQAVTWSYSKPEKGNRVDKNHNIYRMESAYIPVTLETAEKFERIGAAIRLLIGMPKQKRESWTGNTSLSTVLEV